jgi:hypothetical protein
MDIILNSYQCDQCYVGLKLNPNLTSLETLRVWTTLEKLKVGIYNCWLVYSVYSVVDWLDGSHMMSHDRLVRMKP